MVSGCRPADLPYWIHDTLWVLELRDPIVETDIKITGAEGRLLRQVPGWKRSAARAFAAECSGRVRDLAAGELRRAGREEHAAAIRSARSPLAVARVAAGLLEGGAVGLTRRTADVVGYAKDAAECAAKGQAAAAAYVSARAHQATESPSGTAPDAPPYLAERERQAAWFVRELHLE